MLWLFFATTADATKLLIKGVPLKESTHAWLIEDHTIPMVTLEIAFLHAGSAYDPDDKRGLANLVSHMLDEGAGELDGLAFKNTLQELAAAIHFSVDHDHFYIHIKTLSQHTPTILALLQDILSKPRLEQKDLNRVRSHIEAVIKKNQERLEYVAMLQWNQTALGDHPYAKIKEGTVETLASITEQDIRDYITRNFTKENMVISVVGDVTEQQLQEWLPHSLSPLHSQFQSPQPLDDIAVTPRESIPPIVIEKPISQSVAIFGMQAVKRLDPDFYPLYITNHIIGGGSFESRLMEEVREKRGLAYSVYSYMTTSEYGGLLKGYVATESHKIRQSLAIIQQELAKARAGDITEEELQHAKDYLIGSFPLKLDKNASLAKFLLFMQIDNLGIDFLEKRNDYIQAVTLEQIHQVAARYLMPNQMPVIVVGSW